MKTLKLNKIIKATSLLVIALVMSACNKGNTNQTNDIYGFQNCATCGNLQNGQVFFQSQSTSVDQTLSVSLNFVGATGYNYNSGYGYNNGYNTGYGYNNYGYNSPIVTYQGAVAAQGQLVINQAMGGYYGCYIPPGSYSLTTVQAGQWNQAIVTGLVMVAQGNGIALNVTINPAQVAAKQPANGQTWSEVPQVGRLFGNVMIQMSNGYNCQMSTLIQ